MHYYILDPTNVPAREFERKQTELQGLLTEFKINGESARITPLRFMQDLVDTAALRGASTLIACGTDETLNQMLVALKGREFTIGFIPFVKETHLGRILGMTDVSACVKAIASRRIEKIDLAKVNNEFFISYLELGIAAETGKKLGLFGSAKLFAGNPAEIKMRIDDSYTVTVKMMGGMIVNTRGTRTSDDSNIGNPQDGFLDLLLIDKLPRLTAARYKDEIQDGRYEEIPGATVIRCKRIEILDPFGEKIFIDGQEITRVPAAVEILPTTLKMIVGRNRTF